MSSLLDGIDTGPEKPAKGGYRSAPDDESQGQKKKLIIAVVILAIGIGLIVWQMTSGVKPGTVLPPAPGTPVAATQPTAPAANKPVATNRPAANTPLGDNAPPPPKVAPSVGFK